MALLDRLKGILFEPRSEWPKIAAEPATAQSIYLGWVLGFAAIGPLAALIMGLGGHAAQFALAVYVIALVITFILAMIVDALSPAFGGSKDFVASLKLVAYSLTVVWIAGIAPVLLLPLFGVFVLIAAGIYAAYTFLIGAPALKRCAADRSVPYTIVVLLCVIVLHYLVRFTFVAMAFNTGGFVQTGLMR
jgi:Yip1-like protein